MVADRNNPEVQKPFTISFPPKYTACSPFRRATPPMLAFDITAAKLVFMKRSDVDWMEKEEDIYTLLKCKSIPNIAPFGKGNGAQTI
jgi:hypothetical protein